MISRDSKFWVLITGGGSAILARYFDPSTAEFIKEVVIWLGGSYILGRGVAEHGQNAGSAMSDGAPAPTPQPSPFKEVKRPTRRLAPIELPPEEPAPAPIPRNRECRQRNQHRNQSPRQHRPMTPSAGVEEPDKLTERPGGAVGSRRRARFSRHRS